MSSDAAPTTSRPGSNPGSKRAAIIVVLVAVVALAVVAFLNRDRLSGYSGGSTPTSTPPAATTVANTPPEIISVKAATDRIEPFSLCDIVCVAVDADGDKLTYEWSCSAGEIFGEGEQIEWGSPVPEGLFQVSVTVNDGRGGTAEKAIPLKVKANTAPVVNSITIDSEWVRGGDSTAVLCGVSDADGDEITLEWNATAGEFHGQGESVTWVAPNEDGVYWLSVIARDSYGGEGRRTVPVSVTSGEPPKIDGLFVHGVNTNMLRKRGNDWLIYQGHVAVIKCAMLDDTGRYTYEWSADFGTLTPEGSTATWNAPRDRAAVTIAVIVFDEHGNRSSASLVIHVETCTCSF